MHQQAPASPRLIELSEITALLRIAVPALRQRGGEAIAATSVVASAGGPFPLLAAAARLGLPTAYSGSHGTGPLGASVRVALAGIGTELLTTAGTGADSAGTIELCEPDGTIGRLQVPGAPLGRGATGVEARPDDLLHLTGDGLRSHDAARQVLGWLARQPLSAVLLYDPGDRGHLLPVALRARLLARVDWWVGAVAAAHAATGMDAPGAAGLLAGLTRRGVLVTAPSSVVLAEHRGAPVRIAGGGPHIEVVAAFAAGLARGDEPSAAATRLGDSHLRARGGACPDRTC